MGAGKVGPEARGQAMAQDQRAAGRPGPTAPRAYEDADVAWVTEHLGEALKREGLRGETASPREGLALPFGPDPGGWARLTEPEQAEWRSYVWPVALQGQTLGGSGARIATLARRVIARERARAQRSKPIDLHSYSQSKRAGFGR